MLKVVCAWCQRFLRGTKNCQIVSHGICSACVYQVLGFLPEMPTDPWQFWQDTGGEG